MDKKVTARFIEAMLLLRTEKLPESADFQYELKFDGYRSLAIKTGGKVHFRSRNDDDFNARHPAIVKALAHVGEARKLGEPAAKPAGLALTAPGAKLLGREAEP